MNISPSTKQIGLIGHPVAHSISSKLHNHLYRQLGIDMVYTTHDVEPDKLRDAVFGMKALGYSGFNITVPYKQKIISYLDDIDEQAAIIGAVNTVKIINNRLIGYNTDGQGFIEAFRMQGLSIADKTVLIIGAGGSARAIGVYIAKENPKCVLLYNRTFEKANALADVINTYKSNRSITLATPVKDFPKNIDIIVNTTTLGMWPEVEGNPISGMNLDKSTIVCDIVYNPRMTKMLRMARDSGCTYIGGVGMLIGQGLRSAEIWLDKKLPQSAWDIMIDLV